MPLSSQRAAVSVLAAVVMMLVAGPVADNAWAAGSGTAAGRMSDPAKAALMARGKTVYDQNCAACHQRNGLGIPGAFPPIAAGHPFSAPETLLSKLRELGFYRNGRIVEGPVVNQIKIILHGISGTAMPAWGARLNDSDVAAVITFERNSFGNHTGNVVQPGDVKKIR